MYPVSALKQRKAPAKAAQKVDEKQSKDIMEALYDDLDQQDAEELEQHQAMQVNAGPVAFNKEEELALKYSMTVP